MKNSNGIKIKLLLSLILISLLSLPNLSLAQPDTAGTATQQKTETIKDRIESREEALRQEMASRTDAIKNSVQDKRQDFANKIQERAYNFVQNVTERFYAAATRLDILVQRIESRITKIEARDIDVSEAKALLVDAKTKIEAAKNSIALITFPTNIPATTASTTSEILKTAFEASRAQIAKAKQDLKDAHAALIDVVNSLKPGNNKLRERDMASTTATTTESED